ncbi:MAG: helix-turn-helix domain-containing protein [Alphaproteobacteria bacterium]|nr:helix-turn-helix domain-containing protein [Alphaproteobacteria bacterium]
MTKLHNRSLDRGISILQALARVESSSLAELFRSTGLPKSTLRRLLATLQDRGLVRKSILDQRYRCNIMLPTSSDNHITQHVDFLKVALPLACKLTEEIKWPSDIHVKDGFAMKIIDSTRPLSPFQMYQMDVDFKVNIFGSATGMALLASLPEHETRKIHAETINDPVWGLHRFGLNFDEYLQELKRTNKRGYGQRLITYSGERVGDDKQNAISHIVQKNGVSVGVLALLWPREYMNYDEFIEKYLKRFSATAKEISKNLV